MNTFVEMLNGAGQWFVGLSVDMLIQVSVLIVALFVADRFLRRRIRGVIRYWIWTLVLLKLVLPPSLISPIGLGRLIPSAADATAIVTPVESQLGDRVEEMPVTPFAAIPSFSYMDFTVQTVRPEIEYLATRQPNLGPRLAWFSVV